jgi:DNA-binding SARP family transcriptional activator/predicted ATPase
MNHFQIHLFGTFQAALDGQALTTFRSDKIRALLAYLALEANRFHRRETLAAIFWPEYNDQVALRNLRLSLSRLRQTVEQARNRAATSATGPEAAAGDFIVVTNHEVKLNVDGRYCWVDVQAFDNLLAACANHPHQELDRCSACIGRLAVAVDLYQSQLIRGLALDDAPEFDHWRLLEEEKRGQQAVLALQTLTGYYFRLGSYGRAERYARQLVHRDPYQESGHRQLMRILAASGQRHRAQDQYDYYRILLAQELGIEPAPETKALYEQISSEPSISHDSASPAVAGDRLPASLTPFLGRTAELEKLGSLLLDPAYRLVTLMGGGGMGKTHLATAAAARLTAHFAQGAHFVALENVAQPESDIAVDTETMRHEVAAAIAGAIGWRPEAEEDVIGYLLDRLRSSEMLLLLDSFEHLMPVADFVTTLLREAKHLTLLITSRERLNFRSEYALWVGGLSVPSHDHDPAAANYSSVQLFVQQADRTPGGFGLTDANLPDVVRICRQVEGLPLGIELAARWIGPMEPAQIADAIRQDSDFLVTLMGDVPARHRSMRAVFETSWRLLKPAERLNLAQLACFRGDFTAAQAAASLGLDQEQLARLGDKSLLRQVSPGHYRMHQLLNQFAYEKLVELGVEDCSR